MADGWRMEYIGESPVLIAVVIDSSLLTEDFRMPIVGTWAGGGQTEPMAYICAGLAIMNMWLMASSLGLGMCCHNFELTDPQDEGDIASLLGVPYPRWRIAAILSLGYPSGERVLGPKRHPPEEVTYSEKYGEPYRFER
jgi:nitroreductase